MQVLPDAYCVVEALLDVFEASLLEELLLGVLPDAFADVAGSGEAAAAWDGIGVGAAAGCEGAESLAACAVDVSAGAVVVVGAVMLGAVVADIEALGVVVADMEALGVVAATSAEALDELGVDSLVDLPLLLADAVTWLFELDAWREAFVVSFAGLLGFSVAMVSVFVATGAGVAVASAALLVSVLAVSVFASLIVVVELAATLVSARFVWGFAMLAVRAGLTLIGSWPTRWSSTTAPPIATAVMTPNAMPKWFTFFSSWL